MLRRCCLVALVSTCFYTSAKAEEFNSSFPDDLSASPTSLTFVSSIDSTLDGELKDSRSSNLQLEIINNRISGKLADGKDPSGLIISGELIPGATSIVTLRWDFKGGYSMISTGKLSPNREIIGTFFDTQGNTGDWKCVMTDKSVADQKTEPRKFSVTDPTPKPGI